MNRTDLIMFEKIIGYEFKDKRLLEEALRHSSFVNELNETGVKDNERLEFLGDAALNLVVGHILMTHYPDTKEGNLSRMRARLVNESLLADVARQISLGKFLNLGKGERITNGREKSSILADAYEAVLAAVYLDGGFDAVFIMIEKHFSDFISSDSVPEMVNDYKSRLQEIAQERFKTVPEYRVAAEKGPDHDKTFIIHLHIDTIQTEGAGKNKKAAEQDAARKALELLAP